MGILSISLLSTADGANGSIRLMTCGGFVARKNSGEMPEVLGGTPSTTLETSVLPRITRAVSGQNLVCENRLLGDGSVEAFFLAGFDAINHENLSWLAEVVRSGVGDEGPVGEVMSGFEAIGQVGCAFKRQAQEVTTDLLDACELDGSEDMQAGGAAENGSTAVLDADGVIPFVFAGGVRNAQRGGSCAADSP